MAARALQVVITGDPKGFQAALAKAGAATGAFAAKQKSISAKVASAGSTLTKGLTVPLVAAAAVSVKFAADFEKQMSSLGAVTEASGKTMDAFRRQALKAGADTAFSASEAAQAQIELAKGGVNASDILSGALSGALGLAAAGELELGEAAEITANALNLFGLKGSEAGHVADAMATAANETTADVADFGMALGQAGSVAKSAGLNFNQTMTALEALASNGIKGSDAGTSLKTSLIQLLKPTEKQAKLASELGLSFITQGGNMKSLSGISEMLRGKLGGMTKAQRTATLATLAGTDGVRTLTALYDAGPKKLDKWSKGLERQGTAAEVAKRKQDNLLGNLEQLKGSLETLAIIVGSALIPPLTEFAKQLTQVANTLGMAFEGLSPQMKQLVLGVAGVLAAIGPLLFVVGKIAGSFGKLRVAFSGVAAVLGAFSLPVIAVVAALAALGVGFVLAYKHSEEFRKIVDGAFSALKETVGSLADWLSTALPAAFAVLMPLVSAISARFMDLVGIVRTVIAALSPILGPVLLNVLSIAIDGVAGAVKAIGQIFRGLLTVIKGIVQLLTGILTGDFGQMWAGIKTIFSGALTALVGLVRAQFNAIATLGRIAMVLLGAGIKAGLGLVKAAVMAVVKGAIAVVKAYVNLYRAAGALYIRALTVAFRAGVGAVSAAARWVANAAVNAIKAAVGAARAAGAAVANAVAAGIRAVVGAVLGAAKAIGSAFVRGVMGMVSAATGAAKALGSALVSGWASFVGTAATIGRNIIEGLIGGIEAMAGAAADAAVNVVKGALDKAKSFLHIGSPSKVTHGYGEMFSQGFADGISARASTARKSAAGLTEGVIFDLEAGIREAERVGEAMQEAWAKQESQREIAVARRKTKKGDKKERAEAKKELRDLLKEAAHTQKLAKIELKIEGLQKLKAFRDAMTGIRNSLRDLTDTAGATFREMKEAAIDSNMNSELLALDTSFAGGLARARKGIAADPRVAELEAIRARSAGSTREAEDAEIADRMAKAKAKQLSATQRLEKAQAALQRVEASGSQRLIEQAQRRVDVAQAGVEAAATGVAQVEADQRALADQRREAELEAEIENSKAIVEDRAEAQRELIAGETEEFEHALEHRLQAEATQLAERKEGYARFVSDVKAMLAEIGLTYEPSAEDEEAFGSDGGGKGKGKGKKGKGKKGKGHHASGGSVMRRLGEWAQVSELGAELVERPREMFLPHGSRVTPASRVRERGGPLIGEVNIYEAKRLDEQALAERLGFALATRGG